MNRKQSIYSNVHIRIYYRIVLARPHTDVGHLILSLAPYNESRQNWCV